MSEYQYYDFRVLDRPLTAAERTALRKISKRAEISSKRFTNFYTFGDFKGDPPALVARYFDAFLYLANWGTREVMFRVPASRAPSAKVLRAHLSTSVGGSAWFRRRGSYVVLGFRSDNEEGDWESDGEGELDSIVSARSRLLNGGGHALYLGWLLRVHTGEIAEPTLEPEAPAGLGRLSASESALVEFLRIDPDLIGAAAQRPIGRGPKARRTVEQLLSAAKALRREADQRAEDEARREREQREAADAIIRARRLNSIAARQPGAWKEVESLVNSRRPTAYDQAAVLLHDLREISDRSGCLPKFSTLLDGLRDRHGAKGTFLTRLDRLGLK